MKKLLKNSGISQKCGVLKKTNFIGPFYGWGSTVSRLEPLWGGNFLRKQGFLNCFINFPLKKHAFITIGILFFHMVKIHACCNNLEIICTKRRNKLLLDNIRNEFLLNILSLPLYNKEIKVAGEGKKFPPY